MTKPAQPLISRRNAVAALTVGAVASGAYAAAKFNFTASKFAGAKSLSWWQRPSVDLATAGTTDWLAQVGKTFTLASEVGNLNVKLASVSLFPQAGARPRGLRDRAFALTFDAMGAALPEGDRIYTMNHPGGELKMFFGAADKALLAVFN